jgi:hypothetical protein
MNNEQDGGFTDLVAQLPWNACIQELIFHRVDIRLEVSGLVLLLSIALAVSTN